jgi:hypothetical protein
MSDPIRNVSTQLDDGLFADCRNGNHDECLYQFPDPANPESLLTCTCLHHREFPEEGEMKSEDAGNKGMSQAETFEWLRERSNRLAEVEAKNIQLTLELARLRVKPIVDAEREGEDIGDLMNLRLDSSDAGNTDQVEIQQTAPCYSPTAIAKDISENVSASCNCGVTRHMRGGDHDIRCPKYDAEKEGLRSIIAAVITELPSYRDWLDPELEEEMRAAVGYSSGFNARPITQAGSGLPAESALVDEVQRRMDAVVDAAVEHYQSDEDWFDKRIVLDEACRSLLELRSPPTTQAGSGLSFGTGEAWPLVDVLRKLAFAAEHLGVWHDCDHHGYEEIIAAKDAAYRYLANSITQAEGGLPSQHVPESLAPETERFALSGQCDNGMHSGCPYPERCKCPCHVPSVESAAPEIDWQQQPLVEPALTFTQAVAAACRYKDQRDSLASAIAKAAKKAGIYNGEVSLDGPQLIMLCDDLVNSHQPMRSTTPPLRKIVEIADLGSAQEFGDADERLRAIRELIIGENV